MSGVPGGEVLDCLREQFARVNGKLDNLASGLVDPRHRVGSLEAQEALVYGDFANWWMRIDRIEQKLDRIERRLDLLDHAAI